MKVMNVAVVGAGIYGINHVNAYTWNPNTNLVAVCDLNKEITDRIAEQYNVKTYNDVNEMLDNEEIDAVSIATPDAFHMDPALAAIRHGKPILVEKPLATTSEDAKKILAEAEKYIWRIKEEMTIIRDGIQRRSMYEMNFRTKNQEHQSVDICAWMISLMFQQNGSTGQTNQALYIS